MKRLAAVGLIWVLAFWLAPPLWARGGGGCFARGTPILTPHGRVSIEQLAEGDVVWTLRDGKLSAATVVSRLEVQPEEYVELSFADRKLLVTDEHPLQIARGEFRMAARLQVGDRVSVWDGHAVRQIPILAIARVKAEQPAYNLLVSHEGTFLANDVVVHNKGCFFPDTPILRADRSSIPIRDVRVGERLLAFTREGIVVPTTVRRILTHQVVEYLEVETANLTLRVTPEHPFYVGAGTFRTLESLQIGDHIFAYTDEGLQPQKILRMRRLRAPTLVYNLQTDAPNTFFAHGIAVHNKGGGGGGGGFGGGYHGGGYGGGYHGSGHNNFGSDSEMATFMIIVIVLMLIFFGWIAMVGRQKGGDEDLDYTFSPSDIAGKTGKTLKLLEFIAKVDSTFSFPVLSQVAHTTFEQLQQCWQQRDYALMQSLMMPDLYAEHCAQIAGLRQNHEVNMIAGLQVERVDIVNLRYPQKADQREFTALITATARDYYVDDRTDQFLRGDDEPARFQEFWTFQLQAGKWLLREIEQSRESDKLKEENFFEQFTEQGRSQIYAETAKQEGESGPWLEKSVAGKATRIERLLNYLVQTDKLWNRQEMLERARQVFTHVMLAREAGDPTQVSDDEVFPATALDLRYQMAKWKSEGQSVEYRNFCIRKAELILVQNFADNAKDEYTVRISAHAQTTTKRSGVVTRQDEYVTPFLEYWTFGRQNDQWKLKEVRAPYEGQEMVTQENVDEESSPEQLQWYYQHERAN